MALIKKKETGLRLKISHSKADLLALSEKKKVINVGEPQSQKMW